MISSVFAPTTTRGEDVGGKAASLFRLHALGCPVPPFFVLTADATRGGTVTPQIRDAVLSAWASLGGGAHEYAVRSSGVAEDSADNSFAGVFETYLNVHGADGVIAAIEKCLESRRSAAAEHYRESRGVSGDDAMAVVVQRMVSASWSGVCFTADPASQALSVIVVNAVPGSGENLVSGLINPEEIRVDAASGKVIERHAPPGQHPFPDTMLKAVIAESRKVAEAYGFPQDLEWAFDGETLQLLQSRPITTITGVWLNRPMEPWSGDPLADVDNANRVWTRAYADEIWAPPVSPLFYDVQNLTGQIPLQLSKYGDMAPGPVDAFKYYKAAPYLDISLLERVFVYQPRMSRLPAMLNQLPPERRDAAKRAPWRWTGFLRRTWLFEVENGPKYGFTRNHKFLKDAWGPFLADTDTLVAVDRKSLSDQGLDDHLTAIWTQAMTISVECGITVFYYATDLKLLITALLARWFGHGEDLYASVSAGLDDSHTVRESEAIWRITVMLKQAGERTVAFAREGTWVEFQARADRRVLHPIRNDFNAFLALHGHRGANYKDPIHPRWGDDPELLWDQVKAFLDSDGLSPAQINARSGELRLATQRELLGKLKNSPVKRWLLCKLFRYNEIYMSIRDNHRFYYDRIWWLLRLVYVEKGRRLHRASKLASTDDIFFLVRAEIAALADGMLPPDVAAARIVQRRAEWMTTRISQPPKFLRSGYVPDDEPIWPEATAHKLVGLPASAGRVVGRARIVYDVKELSRVGKGDILVTRQTDPSWTPAFARLSGLVLETGGVLAHGASLCREFNVPCVTVVERATQLIRDGDMIVLNGGLGTVEILGANESGTEKAA
jgi:pyruvate,water dikinase